MTGDSDWTTDGDTPLELLTLPASTLNRVSRPEEHLDVWYFPPKLPELNAVEGCWDRLNEWFKHRLIPDLSSLKEQIQRGLRIVDEPNIWNYLCP